MDQVEGDYFLGERVEAQDHMRDTWYPGIINWISSYGVRTNAGRRTILRLQNEVRDPISHQTGELINLRVGSAIEIKMYNTWVPGILVEKNYNVLLDIGRTTGASHREIRRPGNAPAPTPEQAEAIRAEHEQQQAVRRAEVFQRLGQEYPNPRRPENALAPAQVQPVVRPQPVEVAQPVVRPQPVEVAQPAGVAFEIHNAFNKFNIIEFMKIINVKRSDFKNRDAPLKPLIDNINSNSKFSFLKKFELARKIERISNTLKQYSNYDRNINNITACIQYVLMQPQDFIDTYINTFITDCLKAYSSGNTQSCIKGMYERVYFAFRDTVSTICLDQIQGTGAAPLCKPEYIEIFNCFYEDMPTEMLNDYAQQWFQERGEEAGNFSEENRIEDFVGFVRSKVNNVARFRQAERSVRRYAATNINVLFGGRRKRSDGYKKVRKTVRRRKNITMKKRGNNIRNNSRNKQRNKKTRKH